VSANDSEPSAASSGNPSGGANEELWLTYLNYDQRIQQAVRRLGALSSQNVDVFRDLLLKDRDRSRLKEYEAESIRRLQGEAFVGDEALQRTLIVLNAEDPRFGEELKRLVAESGKPAQLDQAVAAIRSGKPIPAREVKPAGPVVPPPVQPPVQPPDQKPESAQASASSMQQKPDSVPDLPPQVGQKPDAIVVPLRKERPAPTPRIFLQAEPEKPQRSLKPLIAIGAAVVIVAVGGIFLVSKTSTGPNTADIRTPLLPPAPRTVARAAPPAEAQRPAPPADNAVQAEADKGSEPSPPLRPASTQPEAQAAGAVAQTQSDVSAKPVIGGKYKVVRGDMLTDIALRVYGDAHKFRLIQEANPSIRYKPNRILADQVIFIPPDKR